MSTTTKSVLFSTIFLVFLSYTLANEDTEFGSFEDYKAWESSQDNTQPTLDEKDVVVLNNTDFWDLINSTKSVMVEFYAPWCGYCQALAPEYAAAATELKEEGAFDDVVLAKVDAIEEFQLTDEFKIGRFPTIYLFTDGKHISYEGERTKDAIVSWLKKRTGIAVQNVTSAEEAAKILAADRKIVLALFDTLLGSDSQALDEASRMEDEVDFYQTTSPDVAKLFGIDPEAKRPALVLLKKQAEKLSVFDGSFTQSAIFDFVSTNKHPLVIPFSRDTLELIFENPLDKQILLFAPKIKSAEFMPTFEEAALAFKEKLIFVYVDTANEDYGKAMLDHFGVEGDAPRVVAYAGYSDGRKYLMDGDIKIMEDIELFAESFLANKIQPFYKSSPVPETNDGDVKVVVGKNFDEIVLDESKDVLLEVYDTQCRHCKSLEPIYERLAKHMRGVDSIVIAKMDGVTNEHPKAKAVAFPTILFFPAGKKSSNPIIFDEDRTVVALYEFLKKQATKPFDTPSFDDDEQTLEDVTSTKTPTSRHHEYRDEL